jgi:hypothetical protein
MYPTKISRRALIILLILCAAIIFLLSLEVLFFVKDADHFEDFQRQVPEATFSDYLNARLFNYIVSLVPVLSLALYTYFLAQRFGTPPLYRLIWGLLLGAAAVLRAVQTNLRMPLSIILLALYIACTLVVINIHRFSESR